jgi:hypothetical protein
MSTASPTPTTARHRDLWIVAVVLGVLIVGALAVGGLAYWWFSAHNTAGLEGTWRDAGNPKHCYEFRANGHVDTWSGSQALWNKIGWEATWRRSGNHITIRTDRNWDFEGELEGDTIRGKMLMRDPGGGPVTNTVDVVWKRD